VKRPLCFNDLLRASVLSPALIRLPERSERRLQIEEPSKSTLFLSHTPLQTCAFIGGPRRTNEGATTAEAEEQEPMRRHRPLFS